MRELPLVVLSERLAPLTSWERSLEEDGLARVEIRPLGTSEQVEANARDATAVMLGAVEPFDAATLATVPGLRLIARRGAGLDNVDVEAAHRQGITVTAIPGASTEEVSDHALVLLLALVRRVVAADRAAGRRSVGQARAYVDLSRPIAEMTLGVIGAGQIGRRLIAKAAPLFGRVVVHDPYVSSSSVAEVPLVDLAELLRTADAVSVHAPLTPATRHLLGQAELDSLPEGAVVVNTARADLVDEEALATAMREGRLGGVGLDVSVDEERWLQLIAEGHDNIVLTVHTGARGLRAQRRLRQTCAGQVADFLRGAVPEHIVNPNPDLPTTGSGT